MRWALSIALLLLAALPATAGKEGVAVLPFEGDEQTVAGAAHDLVTASLSAAGVRLVEREAVAELLAEQRLTAAEAGRLLAASHLVRGSAAHSPGGWRFSLALVAVPSGEVLGSVVETCEDRDLAKTLERAAGRLARLLRDSPPSFGLRADPRALASLHYLRGLGFHRAGLQLEAVGELLEAKRLAVRFVETRYWMAAAYLALGEPAHAAIEAKAFLASAPRHLLVGPARRLLLEAEKAEARPAPPSPRPPSQTLLDRLSSTADRGRKLEVLEEMFDMGKQAVPLLVRAVKEGWTEPHTWRVMKELADLDDEAFLEVTLLAPERIHATYYEKAVPLLTPLKATVLGRRLLSPSRDERARATIAIQSLFHLPALAPESKTALLKATVRASNSKTLLVAQEALETLTRLDGSVAVGIVAARVRDADLPSSHRAEILRQLLQAQVPRGDRLDYALLPLLDCESPVLLKQVLYGLAGSTDPASMAAARRKGAEIVRAWAHPDLALELASYLVHWKEVPGANGLATSFLASEDAGQRGASLMILRQLDPAEAVRRSWTFLADPDDKVRMWALIYLAELAPPETAFLRLLEAWDDLIDLSVAIPARDPLRSHYLMALQRTGRRDLTAGLAPQALGPPAGLRLEDGRAAWKKWYAWWMRRSGKMRKLIEEFGEPTSARKAELLESMGRTGHFPALSAFYRSLPWQEQKALEVPWRKALLAAARELGLPEDQLPALDGDPSPFTYLPMKIRQHLATHSVWKR